MGNEKTEKRKKERKKLTNRRSFFIRKMVTSRANSGY